ncbi:Acyl-CoA dehydrogenase, short-chain specific [Hondaea fermentalgiana]|uniref:Acyl-CoA dehydrogenase, short-chain specific n=1 Tax=Hondaea fermentalgiana TaxID=2315210 RepID=A0A2R5GVK0_9STRA|nr:Acyl-CoA dehydrogenase, short-chain specific [Hondaea fermentalgiana]|eukprot:GBG32431.1 Acyl-CoA dehydrogenase, short-chain specific [Hondaea fermentalgiana]
MMQNSVQAIRSGVRAASTRRVGARNMSYVAPLRDMKFQLDEVRNTEEHYKKLAKTGGEGASPDMVDMILQESAKFAENELYPCNETADSVGCKQIGPNEVKTPPGFKEAYQSFVEGGWQGLSFPEKFGGQGLPSSLALFQSEITSTANWTWTMFPGLSKGAINTLIAHGDDLVQSKYLEKLVSGEWTGTMCLTEPHCGSDLAQVATKAVPAGNGKYKISGTKIFISCGEHDMVDNIVHCVLARLPDAPPGIKGISLFSVPKFKVNDDGTLTDELNGATVGRIENKMGCHGSPTCELIFDEAEGELLGVEHKGMRQMFTFINTSRVGTAIQGLAAAEGAYQLSLEYAKDRLAMRSLTGSKFPDKVADPIIVHPGVRQMLLTQKCIAEGGRGMIYDSALIADEMAEAEANGDHKKAQSYDDRLGFLTPILKGFLTEAGLEAANLGIQTYGGHGYIKSNRVEQIVRDVRIASVWEGTTQIQALDLLGRKVMLQKLKPITQHTAGVMKFAFNAFTSPTSSKYGSIRTHAAKLGKAAAEWQYLSLRVAQRAAGNKDAIGTASVPYLMYGGYVSLAEQWLKQEMAAAKALENGAEGAEAEFYKGKIAAAQFMFSNLLPRTGYLKEQMLAPIPDTMDITPEQFAPSN